MITHNQIKLLLVRQIAGFPPAAATDAVIFEETVDKMASAILNLYAVDAVSSKGSRKTLPGLPSRT